MKKLNTIIGFSPIFIPSNAFFNVTLDFEYPKMLCRCVCVCIVPRTSCMHIHNEYRKVFFVWLATVVGQEPVAGTSRSMQDLDSQQMITDDGFGGSGFGRK